MHTITHRPSLAGAWNASRRLFSPLDAVKRGIVALANTLIVWSERHRQRQALAELDDKMLKDIGLSRAEAAYEFRETFWRA